ncbi:phage holin family protein [Glaciimonas sp. CA11.2]|uniref:phage holin family protein n=1 Tax=unclassified Glaciimonas TaxID=2644401 RepID=UPI002AB59CE6|nr:MULTISPECIES: phage holin family protein [unclassified Glaciimonas]MDY7546010.1 phage holin family protein [Glaciimonas sp. CA11.2]MEB0012146.1 phage holin family protein [Glaciimonas sp. Cout2]MEB0082329.1 phage holin family protein [Glaciimonas sp. Gout2]MEB0163315.1 phage holin family protein [Glaciimonas sp. CA11.2]
MDNATSKHSNTKQSAPHQPGLMSGMVGIAKNMFALIISRIELAALEFTEIGSHIVKLLLVFSLGILALLFALAFWSGLVVVLAWDALGWKILLILAALFSIVAIAMGLYVRTILRQGRIGLPQTMHELRQDRDALL